MKNTNKFLVAAKKVCIVGLLGINVAVIGGVIGAYAMHNFDISQSNKTAQAVQAALKVAAPATSPKL